MAEKERIQRPLDNLIGINVSHPLEPNKLEDCVLEGVDGRPNNCPNNPEKYPENYRPKICEGCPENSELWKVAQAPLNREYIKIKQTQTRGVHPWQKVQAELNEARKEAGFDWKSLTERS